MTLSGKTMRDGQKGFSLLELMIALSIGLILLLALASLYINANRASGEAAFFAQMDQSAQEVFYRLGADARQAGYVDIMDEPEVDFANQNGDVCIAAGTRYSALLSNFRNAAVNNVYRRLLTADSFNDRQQAELGSGGTIDVQSNDYMTPIGLVSCAAMRPVSGCDGAFTEDPSAAALPNCQPGAAGSVSQQIEFAFQGMIADGDGADSERNTLGQAALDCSGSGITDVQAAATRNGFIVNRYFLAPDNANDGESSFSCRGNAGAAQVALVPGVRELAFRYLTTPVESDADTEIDDSVSGKSVLAYQTATVLAGANAQNSFGWAGVVGVEVCVVIAAPVPNNAGVRRLAEAQRNQRPTCARHQNGAFAGNVAKANGDDHFYRRYTKVIALPNALFARP